MRRWMTGLVLFGLLGWGGAVGAQPPAGVGFSATGAAAASETSVVKLVRVNHVDVVLLSELLGGTSIDLFGLMVRAQFDGGDGSGSDVARRGRRGDESSRRTVGTDDRRGTVERDSRTRDRRDRSSG